VGLPVGSVGSSGRRAFTQQVGAFSSLLRPPTYHLTLILRILRLAEATRVLKRLFGPRKLVVCSIDCGARNFSATACLKSQEQRVARLSADAKLAKLVIPSRVPPMRSIDVHRIFEKLRSLFEFLLAFLVTSLKLANRQEWQRDPRCPRVVLYTSCLF